MNKSEFEELLQEEKNIEFELDVDKKRVVNEISHSFLIDKQNLSIQRKKIENKLRKKYIKYIQKNNISYKYDNFENVDFFDIRELYLKEKDKKDSKINKFLNIFYSLFS